MEIAYVVFCERLGTVKPTTLTTGSEARLLATRPRRDMISPVQKRSVQCYSRRTGQLHWCGGGIRRCARPGATTWHHDNTLRCMHARRNGSQVR